MSQPPLLLKFEGQTLMFKGQCHPVEIIAHRGARTHADPAKIAPENTLSAFKEASRHGVGIELDVIATSDGVVVVHHDDDTGRVFTLPNGDKRVTQSSFAEIQQAQLNIQGHEATVQKMLGPNQPPYLMDRVFAAEKIPTLSEVVTAVPNAHLYIELKTDTANPKKNNDLERRVVALIKEKGLQNRVTLISFCKGSLKKVKKLDPSLKTGFDYFMPKPLKGWGETMFLAWCKYVLKVESVHPPYEEITPKLVKKAHKLGLKIAPWVYKQTREEEAALVPKLIAAGVDGIITNAIDLFRPRAEKA